MALPKTYNDPPKVLHGQLRGVMFKEYTFQLRHKLTQVPVSLVGVDIVAVFRQNGPNGTEIRKAVIGEGIEMIDDTIGKFKINSFQLAIACQMYVDISFYGENFPIDTPVRLIVPVGDSTNAQHLLKIQQT